MLEVRNLSLSLGNRPIVKDISFNADNGEIIAFLGPNGAGKTTCMRLLSGVYAPQSGTIKLGGENQTQDLAKYQKQIGFLPEGAPLYGNMSVKEFLEFIANYKSCENPKNAVIKSAEYAELQSVFHQIIETLSKGFKRRVAMAAAILGEPKILILDEPNDGLDPNQKLKLRETIKSLSKGRIIIISTHDLEEVAQLCNRVILFDKGEIKLDESVAKFTARNNGNIEKTFAELTPESVQDA